MAELELEPGILSMRCSSRSTLIPPRHPLTWLTPFCCSGNTHLNTWTMDPMWYQSGRLQRSEKWKLSQEVFCTSVELGAVGRAGKMTRGKASGKSRDLAPNGAVWQPSRRVTWLWGRWPDMLLGGTDEYPPRHQRAPPCSTPAPSPHCPLLPTCRHPAARPKQELTIPHSPLSPFTLVPLGWVWTIRLPWIPPSLRFAYLKTPRSISPLPSPVAYYFSQFWTFRVSSLWLSFCLYNYLWTCHFPNKDHILL